jgi:hypothetical protein
LPICRSCSRINPPDSIVNAHPKPQAAVGYSARASWAAALWLLIKNSTVGRSSLMTLRPLRFYGQEDEDVENSEFPDRDRRRPRSTGQLVVKRSRTIKDADFPDRRRRPRPRFVSRKVVKKIEDEHENRTGDD